jgi:hypothetical protein
MPLLGCPHLIFGIPTLATRAPSFPGPESTSAGSEFVPVAIDFETGGHFLLFRLRVDGTDLEPSSGRCRRWFLQRVAREAESEPRSFCDDDSVWFDVAAGVPHTLELVIGSEHTVVKRVVLRPGENIRWRMPIRTGRIVLTIDLEPGYWYTVEGREDALDLRRALGQEAPSGTRWDLEGHDPIFHSGVEVGSMRLTVLRDADRRVMRELSVPLYSGRMSCERPSCR